MVHKYILHFDILTSFKLLFIISQQSLFASLLCVIMIYNFRMCPYSIERYC